MLIPIAFALGLAFAIVGAIYLAVLRATRGGPIAKIAEALRFTKRSRSACQGTLDGRPCEVSLDEDGCLLLLVGVEKPPPFTIFREGLIGMLGRLFDAGVTSGDAAFDGKFAVVSTDRGKARAALTKDLKTLVEKIFDGSSVTQIDTLWKPTLYQEKHHFGSKAVLRARASYKTDGPRAKELLTRLVALASVLEGVPVQVISLGGERRAERTSEGGARCAWCHDGITGSEPDLVACEKCGTVLHEGCWSEQGGCPTLGCGGKTPEKAAATRS